MKVGPGHGCRRIDIRVQIPKEPAVPCLPLRIPLVLGPGPSPQNQPEPAPREPVLRISPLGRTHSAPRRFSLAQPMEIDVGPNPTQPEVLATTELLQPTPGILIVRPTFMVSA